MIYITPYDEETGSTTAASAPMGVDTLEAAGALMGGQVPFKKQTAMWLYEAGPGARIAISKYRFS